MSIGLSPTVRTNIKYFDSFAILALLKLSFESHRKSVYANGTAEPPLRLKSIERKAQKNGKESETSFFIFNIFISFILL